MQNQDSDESSNHSKKERKLILVRDNLIETCKKKAGVALIKFILNEEGGSEGEGGGCWV